MQERKHEPSSGMPPAHQASPVWMDKGSPAGLRERQRWQAWLNHQRDVECGTVCTVIYRSVFLHTGFVLGTTDSGANSCWGLWQVISQHSWPLSIPCQQHSFSQAGSSEMSADITECPQWMKNHILTHPLICSTARLWSIDDRTTFTGQQMKTGHLKHDLHIKIRQQH